MRVFILSCMLFGASYGFSQAMVPTVQPVKQTRAMKIEPATNYRLTGIVHKAGARGCGAWLEVEEDGKMYRLNAVNFPENLYEDGQRVSFDCEAVSEDAPRQCGGAVHVKNIRPMTTRN